MRRSLSSVLITIIALVFFGAGFSRAPGAVRVVTTLPDLKSIAESIGGNKIEAFSIATGYQNPHFVDPKPSYIL